MAFPADIAGPLWRFLTAPLARADRECQAHVLYARGLDWQTIAVLVTTAVTLTLQEYGFRSANLPHVERYLASTGWMDRYAEALESVGGWPSGQLAGLLFWAVGSLITYVAIPVLVIKLVLRRSVRDFGLSIRGTREVLVVRVAVASDREL